MDKVEQLTSRRRKRFTKEELEGLAMKKSFRSVTRVGRSYRKPRGKNGQTQAARARQDRKDAALLGRPGTKKDKRTRDQEKNEKALAQEARIRKMLARILENGDE